MVAMLKRGLFGNSSPGLGRSPYETPPIAAPVITDGPALGGVAPEPKKRSVLPFLFAAAEDTIARQMGYAPQGVARLNAGFEAERQQAAQLAAEQRKRSEALADYTARKEIDARMAGPNEGTAFQQDYNFILSTAGKAAADQFIRNRYTAPPTVIDNGDGTKTLYPSGALPRSGDATLPSFGQDDWDNAGGTGGNVGGGFPRR